MIINNSEAEESSTEFRYERKYTIPYEIKYDIKSLINEHPYGFKKAYPDRIVNSIYLDTSQFDLYQDSTEGSSSRKKYRIRWYGDNEISNPQLEIKNKYGQVGNKEIFHLQGFNKDFDKSIGLLGSILASSFLPNKLQNSISALEVKLLCVYKRAYFISFDEKFRVTVDDNLRYKRLSPKTMNESSVFHKDDSSILEIKYSAKFDNLASLLTNYLPIRLSRFSKYCKGVEILYLD